MKRIVNNECGTTTFAHDGKLLTPITIDVNHSDEHVEYISVSERGDIGSSFWYISLYSPEYVFMSDKKMTDEEKNEFVKIVNNNWVSITNEFEDYCEELCGEDKTKCKHYLERSLPETPPDYTLL